VVENQTTEYTLPVGGCDTTAKFIMAMIATNHFDPKIIWTTYFDRWHKSKYSYQHFHQDGWKITWFEETVLQSIEMVLSRFGYVGVELDTWEETSTSMDNPFFPNQLNHVFILVEDANNGNKETIYMVDSYTNRHFPRVRCISNWKDSIRKLISSKTSEDRKNNWNHMFSVDMPDLSPRKGFEVELFVANVL